MQPISLKSPEPDAAVPPALRIGIVIAHLGSGGAEKAAVVLASGLADRGYCVDLLTWHAGGFYLKDVSPKVATWLRSQTVPVIVTCGRLTQQKAQDTLLRAFAAERRTMPVRLVILGEGEEREALLSLASQLGVTEDVSLPGVVVDPVTWFAKSDLFVLSSRCEGQSLVLIEALIAGVPIISTDCPSGPHEVLANGRFGELVPVDDVPALSQAMSLTLKKAPEIDKVALRKHLEKFGVDQMIEGYLAAGVVCSRKIAKVTEQTWVR
jgi:glycosyltransferase involved in cell wall biosynthesis